MLGNYFWIYCLFYGALLLYCLVWRRASPNPIDPWPKLEPFRTKTARPRFGCRDDRDCGESDGGGGVICFQGECVSKLSSDPTASCHPDTGDWTLVSDGHGNKFLQCVCRYPHLVTQKNPSSDCVVDIACGPHGRLKDWSTRDACECDAGYAPDAGGRLRCRKQFAHERVDDPCDGPHETERVPWEYSLKYKEYNRDVRCHRKPCSFDVASGRPLSGTFFDPAFGCVCDPTKGYFGVRFDQVEDGEITDGGYYQGCSSIFSRDPVQELDARIYSYFYATDKDPVSFVEWSGLDESNADLLQPHFRPLFERSDAVATDVHPNKLMVGQHWEYHYGQFVLQRKEYGARIRKAVKNWFGYYDYVENDHEVRYESPILCRDIPGQADFNQLYHRPNDYELLYKHLVCRIGHDDLKAPERYRGKNVLNPHFVMWPATVAKSNGFVMRWNRTTRRWDLDLAPAYQEDLLMNRLLDKKQLPEHLIEDDPILSRMRYLRKNRTT